MAMKSFYQQHQKIVVSITVSLTVIIGLVVYAQQTLLADLPQPTELYQHTSAPSTKIYDRHGTLLYEITDPHQGAHTPLTLAEIPLTCREATIATEDASFYQNPGVDVRAIIRAIYINLRGGEVLSGGSTITQQLARNLLLSPQERTEISLTRKVREAMLAWRLARTYSKDEVLTLYLNETYYGNLAYGLEAASRTYFGKHAAELDAAECALLAGLPQSPALYNPLEAPTAAQARQEIVLGLMLKHGFMTEAEAASARREKLQFAAIPFPIKAPHFVMYIRGELERRYGLEAIYRQGLIVQTTLDLAMQNTARRIAGYHLAQLAETEDGLPARNVRNAAVVVMDPANGEILTMLGSPNYFDAEIDGAVNATMATRQPGSSIKPITYAAAFDPAIAAQYGYDPLTPATMMVDVRTAFMTQEGQPYVPQNYDRTWRGPVLLRPSLASSYNLVAVKVLDYIGLEALIDLSRQMGITTFDNKNFGLALTLGGGEVRLVELTAAYGVFANGGHKIEPVAITKISNHAGNVIFEYEQGTRLGPQVLDPRTAFLITDILGDNHARRSTFGAGSPLQLSRPAAAKTGTTQDWRDNWTVGYSPDLLVGVWAGNADNEPMRHVSGVTGAAPIWRDVMETLHKGRPVRDFERPAGIIEAVVCRENGLLPVSGSQVDIQQMMVDSNPTAEAQPTLKMPQTAIPCAHTVNEKFIEGAAPSQQDFWHQLVAVDRRNGWRAGPGCPLEFVILQKFTRYPAEAEAWARKQGVPQIPTAFSPLCPAQQLEVRVEEQVGRSESAAIAAENGPALIFTSPDPGSIFRLTPTIPKELQQIQLSVRPANGVEVAEVRLLVNGQLLAESFETLWQMKPGVFTFEAVGLTSQGQPISSDILRVEVLAGE